MQERAGDLDFEISGDPFSVEKVPIVGLRAVRIVGVGECRQGQFVVGTRISDGERGRKNSVADDRMRGSRA